MLNLFAWLRSYASTLLAAVALAGWMAAGWEYVQAVRLERDLSSQRATFSDERLLALKASARQEADNRAEELRRRTEIQEALNHAEEDATRARADRAIADAAAGLLRGQLARYVAAAREAARSAPTAQPGPPAEGASGVLADVLGFCITRVQQLAAVADDRAAAGTACERSYDALTPTPAP